MSSTYYTLLTGVQTQLQAIAGGPTVVLRKKLWVLEGDPSSMIVVAPGQAGEKIAELMFEGGVNWLYPVVVAYVNPIDKTLALSQSIYNTREAIRNALFTYFNGVISPAYDLEIDPEEVTEFAAAMSTNYDVTGFGMSYQTSETFD